MPTISLRCARRISEACFQSATSILEGIILEERIAVAYFYRGDQKVRDIETGLRDDETKPIHIRREKRCLNSRRLRRTSGRWECWCTSFLSSPVFGRR